MIPRSLMWVMFPCLCLMSCVPGNITTRANTQYADVLTNAGLNSERYYFEAEYRNTKRDEGYYGANAILSASYLLKLYAETIIALDNKSNSLVKCFEVLEPSLKRHLYNYSEAWSHSIKRRASIGSGRYSPDPDMFYVDFNGALSIMQKEYRRMGVFSKIEIIKNEMLENVKIMDKEKYRNTVELYSIISEFISLAENPRGSLKSFNDNINRLESNFSRVKVLAELET